MLVVMIEERRFTEFTELLKATASDLKAGTSLSRRPDGMSQQEWETLVDNMKHSFHCAFVRWAQSHGASCTR